MGKNTLARSDPGRSRWATVRAAATRDVRAAYGTVARIDHNKTPWTDNLRPLHSFQKMLGWMEASFNCTQTAQSLAIGLF